MFMELLDQWAFREIQVPKDLPEPKDIQAHRETLV